MQDVASIIVPALGQGMQDAIVIDVAVNAGDKVRTGQLVAILESDKAVHDISAHRDGFVSAICARRGDRIKVGALIAELSDTPQCKPIEHGTYAANDGFRIRPYEADDFKDVFSLWQLNQPLASPAADQLSVEDAAFSLRNMLAVSPPFGVWVADIIEETGPNACKIQGYVGILPYKNNPTSRSLTAEVSLYTRDPTALLKPSMLLLNFANRIATERGMSFLLGMTSNQNDRAAKMLSACGYRHLGNAGRNRTSIWIFDCE